MKLTSSIPYAALAFAASGVAACSSATPSQQLLDARRAYENAQHSAAARYNPYELLEARQALDRAEQVHADEPGSDREAHLAYIAARKAQIAIVNAHTALAQHVAMKAQAQYRRRLEQQAAKAAEPKPEQD